MTLHSLLRPLLLLLLGLLPLTAVRAQPKPAELLLIGTFHFHNPGADLVKTKSFDVLAPAAQAELQTMTDRIKAFGPQKIFVEWEQTNQAELDELYRAYLGGKYEDYVKTKYPAQRHNFLLKNEIIQLAFRAGQKAGLTRIHAFDYTRTSFPYDSVQKAIKAAGQQALQQRIDAKLQAVTAEQNELFATKTLTQVLLHFNTPQSMADNKNFYLELFNPAGSVDNFAGAYLVSEWYRRNLYMYSIIQKTVAPTDTRVLALVGAGHAAMMREFVQSDPRFRLRELQDVLKK
ncbi:DUF5694 domain-containing protein [Hymenobacter sp. 15J16-1T3B]|uniref:DUF5694 domain-containing protein n=1 Tax=Hymenobacter sp. 15J16-1T3B TaxID=2886941 RepID=UPI001D12D795|nr:DUF5694 domain-containing protein [Hymenobacter sp. 15J16-1T3B]MCC3156573.1 DUF5694 domain-containing protein [Hymenobacter sp. 15J16-1T3B]